MDRTPRSIPELLDRIVSWAEARPDIRGMLLVGSQARSNRPADEWSDLDLAIIAVDPDRYLSQTDWLEQLGHPWITFLEGTIVGALERRVLYEGALDVDFNFFTPEWLQRVLGEVAAGAEGVHGGGRGQPRHEVAVAASVLRRGVRVLLDKDGSAAALPPVSEERPTARPPDEAEFLNVVNDFWYHAVWTAKKLRRGELYIAKGCCDSYMKRLLTDMIVCHARVTHGWDYDTWHDGRFLDTWADPRAVAGLKGAYAHYDAADVRRALLATMDLFRWVAGETAERLAFSYPAMADQRATEWVTNCLSEGSR